MNDVARVFKTDIEVFRGVVSVLTSLRDPALKDRDWDEIRELITNSIESGLLKTKIKDPLANIKDP